MGKKNQPIQMSILAKSWPAHTVDTALLFRLSRYISSDADLKEMTHVVKQWYLRGCRADHDAFIALSIELIERNCKNDLTHLNPADVLFPCLCLPRMKKSLKDLIVKIASSRLSDAVRDTIFSYVVHQKLTHGNIAYDDIILILSRNGAKGATLNPVELRALYVELAQSNNQNAIG